MGLSTAVRAMCVHAAAPAQRIGRPSCSAAPAGSMRRFGLKSAFLKDARPRERLQKKTRAFRAQRKRHPASAREDGAQAPGRKKNAPEMAAAACSVPSRRRKSEVLEILTPRAPLYADYCGESSRRVHEMGNVPVPTRSDAIDAFRRLVLTLDSYAQQALLPQHAPDAPRELHVLDHDRDALGMNRT